MSQPAPAPWRVVRHRSGRRRLVLALAAMGLTGVLTAAAAVVHGAAAGDGRRRAQGAPAVSAPGVSPPGGPVPAGSAPAGQWPLPAELAPLSATADLPAPDRVRIPAIGVDSPLEALVLGSGGALNVPTDYHRAGWFTGGPAPGDLGPAVIAGHVDSTRGPAVFYRLGELAAGDIVEVSRGGHRVAFRVVATERYPKAEFPTDRVYRPTPVPELRLITCGGVFDQARGSYRDNLVVYALLSSG